MSSAGTGATDKPAAPATLSKGAQDRELWAAIMDVTRDYLINKSDVNCRLNGLSLMVLVKDERDK